MTVDHTVESIEVRVTEIAQLFHTLDPFPFRERDLDSEAEEFIVGWARELPADKAITIVVHFPDDPAQIAAAAHLGEALPGFFKDKATKLHGEMKELFRVGRRALLTGAMILTGCLVCAYFVGGFLIDSPFKRLVEESFLILGWVANWRPLEIFLYDWMPIARRRDLYRRLSKAVVECIPSPRLS